MHQTLRRRQPEIIPNDHAMAFAYNLTPRTNVIVCSASVAALVSLAILLKLPLLKENPAVELVIGDSVLDSRLDLCHGYSCSYDSDLNLLDRN